MSLLLLNDPGGIPRAGLVGLWSLPGVDRSLNPGARWEQAAKNLIDWSEAFDNAVWLQYGLSVTNDGATAPDGSGSWRLTEVSNTYGWHEIYQQISTLPEDAYGAGYDLSTGTIVSGLQYVTTNMSDASIYSLGDGWYVCAYQHHSPVSVTYAVWAKGNGRMLGLLAHPSAATFRLKLYDSTLSNGYTADGVSGVYVWRAAVIPGSHTAAECAALYEKTEDRQSFYDFSYHGNHARSGSTTGKDTNDPTIVPTCRNELAAGSTEDLTDSNWTLTDASATATAFTPSAQNGQVVQSFPARSGIEYVLAADIASAGNTDLTWLHIGAAAGDTDPVTVSPTSTRYNVTFTGSSAVGAAVFTGTGTNDATSGGTYTTGYQPTTYRVEIDGTGTPDTFKWSEDGGVTWTATGVAITGSAQTLSRGVTVTFGATTGHTAGDYWDIAAGKNVSLGLRDANASAWGAITFTRVQVEVGSIATYYANPATESVPLLEFDGVNDYLATSFVVPLKDLTILTLVHRNKYDSYCTVVKSGSKLLQTNISSAQGLFYPDVSYGPVAFDGMFPAGQTHIVAITYEYSTRSACGYLDGVLLSCAIASYPAASDGAVYIGAWGPGVTNPWDGLITLPLVYDRPLSPAEVARVSKYIAQQVWDHWGVCPEGYKATIGQKPPMHLGV